MDKNQHRNNIIFSITIIIALLLGAYNFWSIASVVKHTSDMDSTLREAREQDSKTIRRLVKCQEDSEENCDFTGTAYSR